jgi:hypothetical protein
MRVEDSDDDGEEDNNGVKPSTSKRAKTREVDHDDDHDDEDDESDLENMEEDELELLRTESIGGEIRVLQKELDIVRFYIKDISALLGQPGSFDTDYVVNTIACY